MNTASLSDIKKELLQLPPQELVELCVSLAKYKKENKELLGYLMFDSHNKNLYIDEIKHEIDAFIEEIEPQKNLYFVKKNLRKLLRVLTKYSKYINDKVATIEIHIHFCATLKNSGIPFQKNTMLVNLYAHQLKKIHALIDQLHEDIQADFRSDIEAIEI